MSTPTIVATVPRLSLRRVESDDQARDIAAGIGDWSCGQGLAAAATQYRDVADALAELEGWLSKNAAGTPASDRHAT